MSDSASNLTAPDSQPQAWAIAAPAPSTSPTDRPHDPNPDDLASISTATDELGFGVMPPVEGKPPQPVLANLVAFPPNRQTLGGTAYLLETPGGNVLVDSPPWTITTQNYLGDRGVRWLFLTHRNAMAQVKAIQQALGFEIVLQEQEAYLLPELETTTFHREMVLSEGITAIWTPGYSPGSACLHWASQGGVLFTGRHLLPTRQGEIAPLRTSKTFHWPRQLSSVAALGDRFKPESLEYLCPGASIGFLRGEHKVAKGSDRLTAIDLEALAQAPIGP